MPTNKNCQECGILFESRYNRIRCDVCDEVKKRGKKCSHGTKKGRCKQDGCYGNEICEHKNHKQKCPICKPGMKEADKLNAHIINFMKGKAIRQSTKEYILKYSSAPDLPTLKAHLEQNLISKNLKIEDCQLDHKKPKARFDLSITSELLKCCHYKNLQFIDSRENLQKGCKYDGDEDVNELTENFSRLMKGTR